MAAREWIGPSVFAFVAVAGILLLLQLAGLLPLPAPPSPAYVQRLSLAADNGKASRSSLRAQADSQPLVVIDPGHGGFDPGATNADLREKDIVLELARALRTRLLATGNVRVAMTRDSDVFVPIDARVALARDLDADLFLSIHADAAEGGDTAQGASVYTLSNDASSRAAAAFARRENESARINGLRIVDEDEGVASILLDLSQRRSQDRAAQFANLLVREGAERIAFHEQPRRKAALLVLRAPDIPSVLFEAGFISNFAEAQNMSSADGRRRFADATANAIIRFFHASPPA